MAEHDPQSRPAADAPPEQSVEDLLAAAESLVEEIAREAGVEPPSPDPGPEPARDSASDVEAAADRAARRLEELERDLRDSSEPFTPARPAPARSDAEKRGRSTPWEGVREGSTPSEVEPAPLREAATPAAERSAVPRPPLRRRALAATVMGLKSAALLLPNLLLGTLLVLDAPFRRISAATKWRIGVIALMTLLMGVASLVLPKLLAHNPYLEMQPAAVHR